MKAAYPGMNFKSIEQDEVKGLEKAVDESKSRNVAILSIPVSYTHLDVYKRQVP